MKNIFLISFVLVILVNTLFSQIDHWETVVYASDIWKYRPGTSNPPANWTSLNFNDSNWQSGIGGIGYSDGEDNTVIAPAVSLYIRRKFEVVDLS